MANEKQKGGAMGASADIITPPTTDTTMVSPDLAAAQARIAALEAELAAAKAAPAPPIAPSGTLRAKHGLAIVIGGERHDIEAGDLFEASAESLSGLKLGEHYEQASK
jgi:hypothetical protein